MKISKIDYNSPSLGLELFNSFAQTGFAVLRNTPIDSGLVEAAYKEWREFFASDERNAYLCDKDQAGYFVFGSEHAKDDPNPDLKEFFQYYPSAPWLPPGHDATKLLTRELIQLGSNLLWELDPHVRETVSKPIPFDLPSMLEESNQHMLRAIHYPPLAGKENGVRSAAHEDISALTLLVAATKPGLEVKDLNGDWHAVEAFPGDVILNVGDMLQELTNGLLKSTTHRVVNPEGDAAKASRYSIPLFLHFRPDVRLSDRYTAEQYLAERLAEIKVK